MTAKTKTDSTGVAAVDPIVRQVRPIADRLRDSVLWLERDGFATSAWLAREAADELDRLRSVQLAETRQPLTDEQALKAYTTATGKRLQNAGKSRAELMVIVRAIERLHGIGQEGGAA